MHNHNSALELVRPLSHDRDLLVAARLLSIINPQRIVELGAGNGDWLVYIAHQLSNPQLELIGYENFSWSFDSTWARDLDSLNQRIHLLKSQLSIPSSISLHSTDIADIPWGQDHLLGSIDCLRIDCLNGNVGEILTVMRRVLPYTSAQCVFLVDDIVPNSVPNRYLAFMELVKTQQLVPLWMGSKEGMWIRSSDQLDSKAILDQFQSLYPSCDHYYLQAMNQPFWDQNFNYIITREPN